MARRRRVPEREDIHKIKAEMDRLVEGLCGDPEAERRRLWVMTQCDLEWLHSGEPIPFDALFKMYKRAKRAGELEYRYATPAQRIQMEALRQEGDEMEAELMAAIAKRRAKR